jgi:hypothetical protein
LAADIFIPCNPDGETKENKDMELKFEEFKELSKKALAEYFISFLCKDDSNYIKDSQNKKLFKK